MKGEEIANLVTKAAKSNLKIVAGSRARLPAKFQTDNEILLLDLKDCTEILEYCPQDQVITVECGIQLAQLNNFLKEYQQWFPVSYGRQSTTLLDAIVYGECGFLEYLYGGPRRLVLGMTVALSNGDLIKVGGKVVKNVTGYDLTKLFIGSLGMFGIPISANLRLFARPQASCTMALSFEQPIYLLEQARQIMMLGLPLACLTLLDLALFDMPGSPTLKLPPGKNLGRFVLLIRLCESKQVVEGVKADLLLGRSTRAGSKYAVYEDNDSQIWDDLYEIGTAHVYPKVKIDAPYKTVHAWWQGRNFAGLPFMYTPGLGN